MEQIAFIKELLQPHIKNLKIPNSTQEEIATLIAENAPDHQDKLYNLIGAIIAKAKKSSVLKATEICDKFFIELRDKELLYKCEIIRDKTITEEKSKSKIQEEYNNTIAQLTKEKNRLPPMEVIHNKDPTRSTEFLLENCELIVAGKNLIEGARIQLNYGHKYGLIGRNGIGKTQLMGALARYDFEKMPKHLQVLLVEQEVHGSDTTVLQSVLETDLEREQLLKEDKELSELKDSDNQERHVDVLKRLEEIDAFAQPARAAVILKGLGFDHEAQKTMTKNLSGGWRMRVSLARALFVEPDILLLDEPTNHLDLDAVIWLEEYISNAPNTVIIVSHAREFLNNVCTDTIHFFEKQLFYYKGNYDQFEKTRDERNKQQMKEYQKQQDEIEKDKAIIAKFRANNSRASMAQCRVKKLEKMVVIEQVVLDKNIKFNFPVPERIPPPLLKIEDGVFYYNPENVLYEDVQFGIDMDSRIAIVGANGAGKSTLINILLQKLSLVSGQSYFSSRCRVASFTQHHMEQLDLLLTPYEQLRHLFPDMEEQTYRRHLGMFGISGEMQTTTQYLLSGGQKSRIAFAICVWNKPHILILDEPTNHLDLDAVNALIEAIKNYDGGILIVSHDQHLITQACDELWYIKNKRLIKFHGKFDDYRTSLLAGKL